MYKSEETTVKSKSGPQTSSNCIYPEVTLVKPRSSSKKLLGSISSDDTCVKSKHCSQKLSDILSPDLVDEDIFVKPAQNEQLQECIAQSVKKQQS